MSSFDVGRIVARVLVFLVLISLANWSLATLRRNANTRRRRLAKGCIFIAILGIIAQLANFASWLSQSLNP